MGWSDRDITSASTARHSYVAPMPPRSVRAVPDVDDESAPIDAWVRAHLNRLTEVANQDIDSLSPEEFDAALTARLAPTDRLQGTGLGFGYARPFTEHISEVLTLDLPDSVVTLPDERVDALDRSVASLFDVARRNLRRMLAVTPVEIDLLRAGNASCYLVQSDSTFTASFSRFLLEALQWWLPEADTSNGVVFATPHRHAIVLQTCSSPAETAMALDVVPWHAAQLYGEGVGPLSPHTYHWLDRRATTVTHESATGDLVVRPTPYLESLLVHARPAV